MQNRLYVRVVCLFWEGKRKKWTSFEIKKEVIPLLQGGRLTK